MSKLLALTLGDRTGVGPELVAALVARPVPGDAKIVVVGDARVLEQAQRIAASGPVERVRSFAEARASSSSWTLLDRSFETDAPIGAVSAAAGREVLDTLSALVAAVAANEIGGIVYAPLNKQAMRDAGHAAGDELEFFNQHLGAGRSTGEINILGDVWTSRVTSHVPLRAVGDLITRNSVMRSIRLLAHSLEQSGRRPKLAVAALNPHAGEGGAFGREEIDVLAPAVAEARAAGFDIEGPFPSDTIFPRAVAGAFNGVVTMFHDQGQIALKMIGLGQGITLLAGFPVPIATPGHGTAHDIAGKGLARVDGLAAAVDLVRSMMR